MGTHARWVLLLALAANGAFAFAACGGSDETAVDGGDATTDSTSDTVTTDTVTGDVMDAGGDGCSSLGTTACRACCAQQHPDGAATFATALTQCVCEPDKCFDACAPACTGDAAASQQCGTCVQQVASVKGEAGCQDPVGAACTADPDCQKYFGCTLGCP